MEIQHLLDATITMAFDEYAASSRIWRCPGKHGTEHALGCVVATPLSIATVIRCLASPRAAPIPICEKKRRHLEDLDFPGYAIGGLAVGEGQERCSAS